MAFFVAAREWMERELATAESRQDRAEARVIGERICDIIEQEDFSEWNRLLVVWVIVGDPSP